VFKVKFWGQGNDVQMNRLGVSVLTKSSSFALKLSATTFAAEGSWTSSTTVPLKFVMTMLVEFEEKAISCVL
jgi:hypothetical protein